ncbi:hypothetical protein NLG97_g3230 [Lecanicillium saksenae]|uniref:Uncharacterized protein n=1 Tax=Lecanicillium saksenae TaxID=468837 RepID=A0ACC1R1Y1_9HYPO|nr:hypothetical protein NLG97_g3230 [Lecanicillium saksenae]
MAKFSMRPATVARDDGLRFLRHLDSQLPFLAAVGAGEQWGSETRSDNPDALAKYRGKIAAAESDSNRPWTSDSTRAWVIETPARRSQLDATASALLDPTEAAGDAGDEVVQIPVGMLIIEGQAADYCQSILSVDGTDPFIYVKFVVTDRRAGELSRGAGAYALQYAVDFAKALGITRVCLDCWSGNNGRLVRQVTRLVDG